MPDTETVIHDRLLAALRPKLRAVEVLAVLKPDVTADTEPFDKPGLGVVRVVTVHLRPFPAAFTPGGATEHADQYRVLEGLAADFAVGMLQAVARLPRPVAVLTRLCRARLRTVELARVSREERRITPATDTAELWYRASAYLPRSDYRLDYVNYAICIGNATLIIGPTIRINDLQ